MPSSSIAQWLKHANTLLQASDISTARLDALVLLEDCLNTNRAQLLAHPDQLLSVEQEKVLTRQIERRKNHEPLAYIRGKTEFYGRTFYVDHRVLEPRPETETMIDLLLALPDLPTKAAIADVGTGSGAIGITVKLELPNAQVDLLEIDPAAIKVAQKNVKKFTTDIKITQSDLLANTTGPYDILLCNLPYVPDNFRINPAAMNEPRTAIFGGPDGMDLYRRLFEQISTHQKKPLYILTEALPPQHEELAVIAKAVGFALTQTDDFVQVFRGT